MKKRAGFTLIELLVVIAIIAILAAILFPVFAKAREKARQTSCLSNVKQLMLGCLMYASDYDDCVPFWVNGYTNEFWTSMMPYVKNEQIFYCPSTPATTVSYCAPEYHTPRTPTAYYDSWILAYKFAEYQHPAENGWLFETNTEVTGYAYPEIVCPFCHDWGTKYCQMTTRHNGGGNIGFVDGHAKWQNAVQLYNAGAAGEDWARRMYGHDFD